MCGLVGYFTHSELGPADEFEKMGSALSHRGPDDSGVWLNKEDGIGMAHQRLAIVDLSKTGSQPMHSSSGRYVVVFNGEIYNHLSLRQAYFKSHSWRGTSDTETLVNLIEQFGVLQVPELLVGMFAIVVWDKQTKTLHLIRDRFGEKPLYYGWQGDYFYFTSELKALNKSPHFNKTICPDALSLYFQFLYIPSPYSIFKNIYKAPSGHVISLDTNTMKSTDTAYWSVNEMENARTSQTGPADHEQVLTELESHLTNAITDQMVADVPVGAFLSGGVDSSTIVSIMSEQHSERVNTYSIGFNSATHNEAHHAKEIARHLNTNHHEWYIKDSEVPSLAEELVSCFDEPFADSSMIATSAVAKLASNDVSVCITGDGGDELFGGYSRYRRGIKMSIARKRLGSVGRSLSKLIVNTNFFAPSLNGLMRYEKTFPKNDILSNQAARFLQLLSIDSELNLYKDMSTYWRYPYSPSLSAAPDTYSRFQQLASGLGNDYTRKQQYIDLNHYLQDDILVKVDRVAMHQSLETRVPMLDHRFAISAWSLPSQYIGKDRTNKQLLLSIASKRIPKKLLERPKSGFSVPLAAWLKGPLRPYVEESFNAITVSKQGLLNGEIVAKLHRQFFQGNSDLAPLVWSIVCFHNWYKSMDI